MQRWCEIYGLGAYGYKTAAFGKWHNTPAGQVDHLPGSWLHPSLSQKRWRRTRHASKAAASRDQNTACATSAGTQRFVDEIANPVIDPDRVDIIGRRSENRLAGPRVEQRVIPGFDIDCFLLRTRH